MAQRTPTLDYAILTDAEITQAGLNHGENVFTELDADGATNSDSLFVLVGEIFGNSFHEMGRRPIGPDAAQFEVNVSPVDGKLAAVVDFGEDSITVNYLHGSDGPRRWTGGVRHVARVEIDGTWLERTFAGAASGAQGHVDMEVVYAVLLRMGRMWALREKARAAAA